MLHPQYPLFERRGNEGLLVLRLRRGFLCIENKNRS